jgi:hypothetical protein
VKAFQKGRKKDPIKSDILPKKVKFFGGERRFSAP